MVQIADTQERWSTHSHLADGRVCHDGRVEALDRWRGGEEEKRRGKSDDGRVLDHLVLMATSPSTTQR